MDFPWAKWAVFLHPTQRKLVERDYNGPFRVSGPAGTGKTVVAIHRAVYLARNNPEARVLLTTFSETLAGFLRSRVTRLIRNEPRLMERLEVAAIHQVCERLYKAQFGVAKIATMDVVREILTESAKKEESHRFSIPFLVDEWENVVDAWQLDSWEAYRDVRRLGRKPRLPIEQRSRLWAIFEGVKGELQKRDLMTQSGMCGKLAEGLNVVIHRMISLSWTRHVAHQWAADKGRMAFSSRAILIFQAPFSWKTAGVDVRGRSEHVELSNVPSDQDAGGPTSGVRSGRRGWQCGGSQGNSSRHSMAPPKVDDAHGQGDRSRRDFFVRSAAELDRARCLASGHSGF